jgi:hypothetical protein
MMMFKQSYKLQEANTVRKNSTTQNFFNATTYFASQSRVSYAKNFALRNVVDFFF